MKSSLQYFLVFSFFLFAITGLALGYLASYFLLKTVAYLSPWLPVWMWYADIGLYVQAVTLAATSTVGVIAILANKLHALKLCSFILISLVLVEIMVTVQVGTRRASLETALEEDLQDSMGVSQNQYSLNISDTQMWDEIQLEVNCCGLHSYKDWFETKYGNGTSVPDSCCLLVSPGCGSDIATKTHPGDEIIIKGCLITIMNSIEDDFNHYASGLWLPVLGSQTILILMVIYLVRKISLDRSYYPYIISPSLFISGDSSKYEPLQDRKI